MSCTVGRRHVGLGEDGLVENGGRSVEPAKGSVGLVLKWLDLSGIAHFAPIEKTAFNRIEAHALAKSVLCAIIDCILEPIRGGRRHARFGLKDKKLVGRTGVVLVRELEPDNNATLCRVISVPAILIAQVAWPPIS